MRDIIFNNRGSYSYWQENKLKIGRNKSKHEKRGGGLFLLNGNKETIEKKVFVLNGFIKDGGAIYLNNCNDVLIKNCLFILNFAKWGGGIYIERCKNIEISNNFFLCNFAVRDGGAISISYSEYIFLTKNNFVLNLSSRRSRNLDVFKSSNVFNNGVLI